MTVIETEEARRRLLLASLSLNEGNLDIAINQAEIAVELMKELRMKKREEMQNGN